MSIEPNTTHGSLFRFLTWQALALASAHLGFGWCWVLTLQPNEFAGIGFVIALKATPVMILLAAPFHVWIWKKAGVSWRQGGAFVVSLAWITLFNLPYLFYLPQ